MLEKSENLGFLSHLEWVQGNSSRQPQARKKMNYAKTKNFTAGILGMLLSLFLTEVQAQCEADTTIYLTDFVFTPSAVTISVGQTVAFVNAEGIHNVDGTAESNPVPFFLDETEGNINGVCMGTVTFDVPGTYTFTSSIGVQPELGMTGTIVVDAETLADVMADFTGGGELENLAAWQSCWAFTTYYSANYINGQPGNTGWVGGVDLAGNEEYTVFVPTDAAVNDLMELMNLSQFDMLAFYDMVPALAYHIIPGVYMASDLEDGMTLPTAEGQSVTISIGDAGAAVDAANIIYSDIAAFNGVIHVIDGILAPAGYPSATTWDAIVQSPDHTILEQALLNEGLNEALRGQPILNDNEPAEGPFTVFAPTDDAFIAFAEENGFASVSELLQSQFMDDILHAHLVEAVYESNQLYNGQNLSSYNNQSISIAIDADGVSANTAPVIQPDILAYNGVVHALGEVMPFDFPAPAGTCGTWTIHMTSNPAGGTGWGGATVNVLSNGILIASETKTTNAPESFMIPVDEGSRIDVIYIPGGTPGYHGFEVVDESGNTVYESQGSVDWNGISTLPMTVYGLNPCGAAPTCGLVEIQFLDDSQDGWYGGSMGVYSESGLEANIFFNPDFDGDGYADYQGFMDRRVAVTVDAGEVDFIVNQPVVFAEYCGYIVRDPSGQIVVDQNIEFEEPASVSGVVICESEDTGSCNAQFDVEQATTENGTPIAGAVNVVIYDYNPNASYAWDFGDEGGISDEPFPTYTYEANGPYTLCLTVTDDAADCTDTYCEAITVDSLGLLDGFVEGFVINVIDGGTANAVTELNAFFSEASVYPNPASDWLMVSGIEPQVVWNARLMSLTGQIVSEFNGTGPQQLALSGITPGMYLLQFNGEQTSSKTLRVVIE